MIYNKNLIFNNTDKEMRKLRGKIHGDKIKCCSIKSHT